MLNHSAQGEPSAAIEPRDDAEIIEIYQAETPWLIRMFRRALGNHEDAVDLAHETIMRFMRAAPTTAIATPQAYLRRSATNLLRNRIAHSSTSISRASVPLVEGLDVVDCADPLRELVGRDELARWDTILDQLPPKAREVFLLARVDGYTYAEISVRLGLTARNVKTLMIKAIAHIDRHRDGH